MSAAPNTKPCTQCMHFDHRVDDFGFCLHPALRVNYRDGAYKASQIDAERNDHGRCGPGGLLFHRKTATPEEIAAWRHRGYGLVKLHAHAPLKPLNPGLLWAYEDLREAARDHGIDSPQYRVQVECATRHLRDHIQQAVEALVAQSMVPSSAPAP